MWKDRAKETTRRCAREAGMGDNVMIITEPEAAAIHALDMMDPHGLRIGQGFIVADFEKARASKLRLWRCTD